MHLHYWPTERKKCELEIWVTQFIYQNLYISWKNSDEQLNDVNEVG